MPFLFVSGTASVDERVLAKRLCPYSGELSRVGPLWFTSLVRHTASFFEMPSFGHRSACSAYGRIDFEGDVVRFSTDPLGTLPLWRVTEPGFTAVSPEVKAFTALGVKPVLKTIAPTGERAIDWSPYQNVDRLPPGSSWELGAGEVKTSPWPELLATSGLSRDTTALGDALEHSLGDLTDAGAFISGGIDSSIAAALVGATKTWSLGTRVGNEFAHAADLARHLTSTHAELQLVDADVRRLWNGVIRSNEIIDGMTAEIVLQLAALVEKVNVADVVTGYGADLLFGGMLRHDAYMQAVGVGSTRALIARTMWTGELSPFYAWQHGVAVHPVFWSPDVIRAALRLDPSIHFDGTHEKVPLRRLAVARGWLTEPLAFRAKVGMTVGTAAYQLVADNLGLDVFDYGARSRLAFGRLLLEFEQEATG